VYRRRKIVESFLKFSPILIKMPNIFIQQMHINPKGGIELISQPGPFVSLSCFFFLGGGGGGVVVMPGVKGPYNGIFGGLLSRPGPARTIRRR
jgi:hypothetical protein